MDFEAKWQAERERKAFLALDDGTVFHGVAFGARKDGPGEVVFNTGMSGYQEILTDPSYAGQFVALTTAEVGNFGVKRNILRSLASWARAKVFPAQTPAEEVLAFQPDGVSSPTARPTPPPSPTPLRTSRSYWVSGLLTSLHSPAVNRQPRRRIDKRRATRPFDLSTF